MTTFLKVFTLFAVFGMMANVGHSYPPCPNVEAISKRITEYFVYRDPTLAAGLIRMLFHDCIVRGCDASVLLDPTPSNNATEKTATPNLTLRGYEVVNAVKAALEKECPGKISCADVLSLVARDAIVAIKGPYWFVNLGRKDGKISLATDALRDIPSPFSNITTLIKNFAAVGLTPKDLTVLSGAHTIGIGHCNIIQRRLYNFTGKEDTDPKIAPGYATFLKSKCPQRVGDLISVVPMDAYTPKAFDVKYFTTVSQKAGLFSSDAALLDDSSTKSYLLSQVYSGGATFGKDFAVSMTKLIKIGGTQGEIRKTCGAVNSYY
ncbi:peroxidase 56-like [Silene latifolia]|uniref:peroxidase 56-like n=1 Tax=Silene latifolia TaxID=37657 RepID=UPI003D7828C6